MAYSQDEVNKLIEELAPAMGVDPRTAKIVIGAEQVHRDRNTGGWKFPAAYSPRPSPVGAEGVGQVMPRTRQALVDQGHLPKELATDTSLRGQVAQSLAAIKEMLPRTGTDPLRIAAAYNGGVRAGKTYGTPAFAQAPAETRTHVQKAKFVMDNLIPDNASGDEARLARKGGAVVAPTQPSSMLDQLWAGFRGVGTAANNSIDALRSYQSTADAGLDTAKNAILEQAEGNNMISRGAADAAAIKQNRVDQVTQMFSLTDADIAKNRDEYALAEAARLQKEDEINQRLAVGFFDNPIAYLTNLTRLPGMVQEHNALARKTQQLDDNITQRQQHSASHQNVTAASAVEAIRLQEEGKAKAESAKARERVAALEIENAGTNAKNLLQVLSVESGQAEMGARIAQMARDQLMKDEAFAKLKKEEQEQAIEVKTVNTMLEPLGSSIDERTWKEMTPASKLPLRTLASRGSYGNSLAEAYETITGSGLYNRSKATPSLVATIDAITDQVNARARQIEAKDALKKGKPQEYRAQALAGLESEWKEAAAKGSDRERQPQGSPFTLNFNFLLASGRYKDTMVGEVMQKRAQSNMLGGAAGLQFDDFAQEALAQVMAKKKTPGQAAQEIASFYSAADTLNYAERGLAMFHIPMPQSYTVFAGPAQRELDARNPAQVEQFLQLRSQALLQQQIQQQFLYQLPVTDPLGIMQPRK
jgi:hypothetical protein